MNLKNISTPELKHLKSYLETQVLFTAAKERIESNAAELVCASIRKYDVDDLIVSDKFKFKPGKETVTDLKMATKDSRMDELIGTPINPKALPAGDVVAAVLPNTGTQPKQVTNDNVQDNVAVPGPQIVASVNCSNCRKDFNDFGEVAKSGEVKCPNCFAILGEGGVMKYPPQIIDFSMSCPACKSANWKLLKTDDASRTVKCMTCAKEYTAELDVPTANDLMDRISFVYSGSTSCPQCGNHIPFSTTNKIDKMKLSCAKCNLGFTSDLTRANSKKKIKTINEVLEDNLTISSEKGGITIMSEEKKDEQPIVDVTPVVTTEVAPVVQAEEPKVEAKPKEEVDPLAEAPAEVEETDLAIEADCELVEASELEEAKTLKAEDQNALKDSDFAVVKTVKNKKTGEPRKIRMYPMHDEAHVKNALARINQAPSAQGLKDLGISIEAVKAKIHAKAKKMGIKTAEDNSGSNEKIIKADAGPDMQKAEPRKPIVASDARVAGLVPDQVNQMQNQLFAEVTKHKATVKKAVKKIRELKKAMKSMSCAANGSDTDVKTEPMTAEELAKLLAEGKPLKASVNGFDVTIKVEGKTAEQLAEMLTKGEPVMSSVQELNIAMDENKFLKEKIQLLETSAVKLLERKNVLGEFSKELSEKDILDDDKFEVARLKKENATLKLSLEKSSSTHVSEKTNERDTDEFSNYRAEIDAKAFKPGKIKK